MYDKYIKGGMPIRIENATQHYNTITIDKI
jgi:hypothetical protein